MTINTGSRNLPSLACKGEKEDSELEFRSVAWNWDESMGFHVILECAYLGHLLFDSSSNYESITWQLSNLPIASKSQLEMLSLEVAIEQKQKHKSKTLHRQPFAHQEALWLAAWDCSKLYHWTVHGQSYRVYEPRAPFFSATFVDLWTLYFAVKGSWISRWWT